MEFKYSLSLAPAISYFTLTHVQKKLCSLLYESLFTFGIRQVLVCGQRYHGYTTGLLCFAGAMLATTNKSILYVSPSRRDSMRSKERFEELHGKEHKLDIKFYCLHETFWRHFKTFQTVVIFDLDEISFPASRLKFASFVIVCYTRYFSSQSIMSPHDSERIPPQDFVESSSIILNFVYFMHGLCEVQNERALRDGAHLWAQLLRACCEQSYEGRLRRPLRQPEPPAPFSSSLAQFACGARSTEGPLRGPQAGLPDCA